MKVQAFLRRKWLMGCLLFALLIVGYSLYIYAKDITLIVNGKTIDNKAAIYMNDNRMMVSEALIESEFGKQLETAIVKLDPGTYYKDRVAVLMYHHIEDHPTEPHVLSAADFDKQMELLELNGFKVITFEEYTAFMTEGKDVPDNAVLLTFDDGYESFYTLAYPILKKYGYTATNFVMVAAVDNRTGVTKMTWDQMREMKQAGMSFYSHTYDSHYYRAINSKGKEGQMLTHPLYIQAEKRVETEEEYKKRIATDLEKAEKRLREELGNDSGVIAFPFGAANDDVFDELKSLHIELSFTIDPGLTSRRDKNAYRFNAGGSDRKPEDLIETLKSIATGGKNEYMAIKVDGEEIFFAKQQPMMVKDELMIPLKEFCKLYDIRIKYDKKRRTVELTTP
ncbi:polysaccharide deacetylase family protein [Paenibacillus marinisediminis]